MYKFGLVYFLYSYFDQIFKSCFLQECSFQRFHLVFDIILNGYGL